MAVKRLGWKFSKNILGWGLFVKGGLMKVV